MNCIAKTRKNFSLPKTNLISNGYGVSPIARHIVKDSINNAIILNRIELVNPEKIGTKAAAHYQFTIAPNEMRTIRLRLRKIDNHHSPGVLVASLSQTHSSALTGASRPSLPTGERVRAQHFHDFDEIIAARKAEANEFYNAIAPANLNCRTQSDSAPGSCGTALDQTILLLHC